MGVPEALRPLLDGLVALLRERLSTRVEGVYLIGSLAHGGWSARLSDVDLCVALKPPLRDGDGPALVAIAGEMAERFPRHGPRLSLFWATDAILRGETDGGRLGPIEAADLAQNGRLLWGEDCRGDIRSVSREELLTAMYADLLNRWKRRLTPFTARDALVAGTGADLDERTLIKACLYPARFLYTAETGRIGGIEQAAAWFAERYGKEAAAPVGLAAGLRERFPGPEASKEEREQLGSAFVPLTTLLFSELRARYGFEPPRDWAGAKPGEP